MAQFVEKQLLRELHKPSWAAFHLYHLYLVAFLALCVGIGWAVLNEQYALLVPLVLLQAFVMHSQLIAFHEASHGALCPIPLVNGYLGRLVGVFGFMSLTLYRAAHHWHHAYIGDARDEEFWPHNDPTAPRWKRRAAAFFELTCGLAYTPFLFLRMFLRRDSAIRDRATRRLIWADLVALVVVWTVLVGTAVYLDAVPILIAAYLIPAVLAGNLQSLRKYVEHMGLTGPKMVMLTRSVRDRSLFGRIVAWLVFQEPYHDVHHLYPKIPQEALPTVAEAENPLPPELPVFGSYAAAFRAMVKSLADPKFGKAWTLEPAENNGAQPTESGNEVYSSVGSSGREG